ncbi:flagellar hook-length control protein FliK [Microvirga roseola]|uniref:flagellar hook-length control protein FliK n=1 Tax=Microvirga roseola TaxID=2883126 RepID=UPI001E34315E|nr:flagellar hook-length control protein FliK [Microvirga roseola]
MNKFEILPQSMPRRAEASPSKVISPLDSGGERDGAAGEGAFKSLLDGFSHSTGSGSEAQPAQKAHPLGIGARIVSQVQAERALQEARLDLDVQSMGDEALPEDAAATLGELLKTDTPDATKLIQVQQSQAGSAVVSVFENLLPKLMLQTSSGSGQGKQDAENGSSRGSPLMPGSGLEKAPAGKMLDMAPKVTVQYQETHFKPIVEGFSTKIVSQNDPSSGGELTTGSPAGDDVNLSAKTPSIGMPSDAGSRGTPNVAVKAPAPSETELAITAKGRAAEVLTPHAEAALKNSEVEVKAEGNSSLPPGTLQRVAGAILAQTGPMAAELNARTQAAEGATFVTTARASEGVMRMLNIQLHPAELGLMTVRMRLSGDDLTMEIEVASDETAHLLRTDSEKLSNLLRGSGYRPEVISIQVAQPDATQQQGMSAQRDSGPAFQQEGFGQGSLNRDERPRQQDKDYDYGMHASGDVAEESTPSDRRAGGVYL